MQVQGFSGTGTDFVGLPGSMFGCCKLSRMESRKKHGWHIITMHDSNSCHSCNCIHCVQDAREYFQHLLEVMTRAERTSMQRLGQPDQPPTADVFRFELEDRIQCMESSRLSYKRSLTNVLAMDIPVDAATNKDELEDFQVQS